MSFELPERTRDAEDAFVQHWAASDDDAGLVEVVGYAIDARRPRLAARLVGLLADDAVPPEAVEAVAKARKAADLLLLDGSDAPDGTWSELEEAWSALRKRRMRRIKRRQRKALHGKTTRTPRLPRSRDKRR